MNKTQLRKWREDYTVWDAPCLGDGLALHVHFDEKDDVKRMGGRWHPDPSGKGGHWWMPIDKLEQTCPFEDEEFWGPGGSGTVIDWLNNHKMIAGQYQPNAQECKDFVDYNTTESEQYEIINDDSTMTFRVYPYLDVVDIGNDVFQTVADSRTIWDDMMKVGWRKVISTTSEVSA
tara:strand:+ start:478 stop:1002 length:525 start_codon:yes stop_codon:yes gene_type:complete